MQQLSVWQARFDVHGLFTDVEIAKGSFPSRRTALKYELTQERDALLTDAAQLLRDCEVFRELQTIDAVSAGVRACVSTPLSSLSPPICS